MAGNFIFDSRQEHLYHYHQDWWIYMKNDDDQTNYHNKSSKIIISIKDLLDM